jgi:hypothetical protein
MNPGLIMVEPLARSTERFEAPVSACLLGTMSTATVSYSACAICEAIARFQTSA